MIGQVVSHYRILDQLDKGGMGVVYIAEDTHLGRRVALKFAQVQGADPRFRARFLREARLASTLNHPNIATIHDYGETADGQPFIVMELIKGRPFNRYLETDELTITQQIEVIIAVALGLGEAHRHGIVHRDIKPQNVIINERGEVKVLDFGLARQFRKLPPGDGTVDLYAPTRDGHSTGEGIVLGTPYYMSPEQAQGTSADADARSDLFSLGVMLYRCLTRRLPFTGGTAIEICVQVLNVTPPPPSQFNPQVTGELDRITLKALAKQPEARYQSADEFIADLRTASASLADFQSEDKEQQTAVVEIGAPPQSATTERIEARLINSWLLFKNFWQLLHARVILLFAVVIVLAAGAFVTWRQFRPALHQPLPDALPWYEVGCQSLREGAYYQASQFLERAVRQDSQFTLAHARLAEALAELDYTDKAQEHMLRVSVLAPDRARLPEKERLYLQAILGTLTRDFTSAVINYRELLQRVPQAELVSVYLDLGRAYEKNEEIVWAIESYQQAIKYDAQAAVAHLRLGILYGWRKELAKATSTFNDAERLYQGQNNAEGVAEVYYRRGALYDELDQLADARRQLEQALEKTKSLANQFQRIKILLQLSSVAFSEGKIAEAQQQAAEALASAEKERMENLTVKGIINLGQLLLVRNDYDQAESYFVRARGYARKYNAKYNVALAQVNLGSVYIQQNRLDEGLQEVEQALPVFQLGGYRREYAQALLLVARVQRRKGNYPAAQRAYEEQLQLARQSGDQSLEATARSEIGRLLAQQERYAEAHAQFEESYKLNLALSMKPRLGYDLTNLANMRWRMGDYNSAQAALRQAIEIISASEGYSKQLISTIPLIAAQMAVSEEKFRLAVAKGHEAEKLGGGQYSDILVQIKYTIGLARALSGSADTGVAMCEEALSQARQNGDPRLLVDALLALARASCESGNWQATAAAAHEAQELCVRLTKPESEWRASLLLARADLHSTQHTDARVRATRVQEALKHLERLWGREAYNHYLNRPDIQRQYKESRELLINVNSVKPKPVS